MPSPIACWQCGTVISAPGGRCPACGVEQANPPQLRGLSAASTATTTAPRSRMGTPVEPAPNRMMPWLVLALGLVAIAVLAFLFAPRSSHTTDAPVVKKAAVEPAPSGSVVNELGVKDLTAVDPLQTLARARARAIAWHPDALLVSVYAAPVGEKGIDLETGGKVEYVFGRPTGDGFGAGARVSKERLTIGLTSSGEAVTESSAPGANAGRAAIDPNCPFDEVLKKVRASGVPTAAQLVVAYEFSEKHDRTIFRVSSPGDDSMTRALDGQTCAILVR